MVPTVLQDREHVARRPALRVLWVDAGNVAGRGQPADQAAILFRDALRRYVSDLLNIEFWLFHVL